MSTVRLGSEQVFDELTVYRDLDSRSAALNMAIDEALLEVATEPTIRFYRWDHPALSFGYFGRFADIANEKRDIVRRWTGGGIVFHGEDLTYSIVIPANHPAFGYSSMSIYEQTHAGLRAVLAASGKNARLAETPGPKVSDSCFANAVRADVLWNGQKIAGAAQRRTRRGLLQQGSIQNVDLTRDFSTNFARQLSSHCKEKTLNGLILERAHEIADQKYTTASWLQRR